MTRRTADRPCTDAEERALIALADLRDRARSVDAMGGYGTSEYAKPCRNSTTLCALNERGLVELRTRFGTLDLEARITDEGYALVRGMGD